jgi:HPt (histidine-containing phosphotransfer) domain-containing protein
MQVTSFAPEPDSDSTFAPGDRLIDLVHLARMTLGDRGLEREVLHLFRRQIDLLLATVGQTPSNLCAAVHSFKGSARGVGAWRLALAAEAVEIAAQSDAVRELDRAVEELGSAALATREVIIELLRPN